MTAKRNPNTGKITASHYFDLGRIGPVTIAADGGSWDALLKYIESEPDNFLSDALEAARSAAAENTLYGRVKKPAGKMAAIRQIAPHLYVELRHWLKRKPLHPVLAESLAHHGIKPDAPGRGTPPGRVLLKMINSAYGKRLAAREYRTFYKNYIQPRLAKTDARHKKAGYPMNHKMLQEVLFPKK
jgi:hypothetical protein